MIYKRSSTSWVCKYRKEKSINKSIKIISKNLYINLLNVKDIVAAINIILYRKIESGNYNLTNNNNFKILNILSKIKKNKKTKLKKCV